MHETSEFMQGFSGGVGGEVWCWCCGGRLILCTLCVCVPILQSCKEFFCRSKGSLGSFASSSSVFSSLSILPHTFEPLCGIVPWSWLGSLLPRPLLPPGQLAHAPLPPDRMLPAGARLRGLQKALKPGKPESLLPQFRTGWVGG